MDPMASPSIDIQLPKDQVPRMEESSYKLYGYGLCKGEPAPKWPKIIRFSIFLHIRKTWNFWWFLHFESMLPDDCGTSEKSLDLELATTKGGLFKRRTVIFPWPFVGQKSWKNHVNLRGTCIYGVHPPPRCQSPPASLESLVGDIYT